MPHTDPSVTRTSDGWARSAFAANGFGNAVLPSPDLPPTRSNAMQMQVSARPAAQRYAKCVEASKRIRWDIDRDVIRGREFDYTKKFLPDGLSRVDRLGFLSAEEQRFLSQVQGRSYANIFGLVERFISAKFLECSRGHVLGDQAATEALVRSTDEELKHQELFRRLDAMMSDGMPDGYEFLPDPDEVARAVLSKSTWSVLALICHIELFVLQHYRASIDPDPALSPLFKDVFLYHWKEESQHAIVDELEWIAENAKLSDAERDAAVDDLIALVGAVDGILQAQAASDARYFVDAAGRSFEPADAEAIGRAVLDAYRWQYIVSGVSDERFAGVLASVTTPAQLARIQGALAPLLA
ncbi:MAG: hypothetical protein BroJett026_34300 [Betaproteobacteria bacterium]|nr:MAG: hypothetical protein BroJett026_34300 [Betaproteobacteria bacterium]